MKMFSNTDRSKLYMVKTARSLGLTKVYRTESALTYYKGKSIWGRGRYFSLTKLDSERINNGGEINEYKVPQSLKLVQFDLTWGKDPEQSSKDWDTLGSIIGKSVPEKLDSLLLKITPDLDGLVILSNSHSNGYNQLILFPKSISKIKMKINSSSRLQGLSSTTVNSAKSPSGWTMGDGQDIGDYGGKYRALYLTNGKKMLSVYVDQDSKDLTLVYCENIDEEANINVDYHTMSSSMISNVISISRALGGGGLPTDSDLIWLYKK